MIQSDILYKERRNILKKQIISLLILAILLIGGLSYYIFFIREKDNNTNNILTKYTNEAQITFQEQGIKEQISTYNQTLDIMASSPNFKKEHLDNYLNIKYVNKEEFSKMVETFLDKNYTSEEINQIFEYLSDQNIQKLLEKDYVSLDKFYQITNLNVDKIEEYLTYQNEKNIDLEDAVTEVNLHLNEEFYSNIITSDNPDDILVLVNKYHALPADYVPSDLVEIGYSSLKMRAEAAEALQKLIAAAALDNITLIPYSTYRSYDYQKGLYEKYLTKDPVAIVDTYSARPGHSEHQTGLACDIGSAVLIDNLTDQDYKWMLENAHQYGYIVRYPKNQSEITGYKEEPWHIRYIGIKAATKIHELGITFDEYYDLYVESY